MRARASRLLVLIAAACSGNGTETDAGAVRVSPPRFARPSERTIELAAANLRAFPIERVESPLSAITEERPCTLGDSGDGRTCVGPWLYQDWKRCPWQGSECPPNVQICPQENWKTCRHWEFGRELQTNEARVKSTTRKDCERRCANTSSVTAVCAGGGFPVCTRCAASINCETKRNELLERKRAELPPEYRSEVSYVAGSNTQGSNSTPCPSDCNQNASCTAEAFCDFKYRLPVRREGRGPPCGCAQSMEWPRCELEDGVKCGTTTRLGFAGATREALIQADPKTSEPYECTTCEALGDWPARVACLKDEDTVKARKGGFGAYPEAARLAAIRNQKVLYELYGGDDEPLRRWGRDLYATERDVHPSCGAKPVLLDVPAACPELAPLSRDLGRCERLLGSHVGYELRARELPACLTMLEGLLALGPSKDVPCGLPARRELAEAVTRQLLVSQLAPPSKQTPREPRLFELPRQLYLVNRWYQAARRAAALKPAPVVTPVDGGAGASNASPPLQPFMQPSSAALDAKLEQVLHALWQKLDTSKQIVDGFEAARAATTENPEQLQKLLEGVNLKRIELEADVLEAALTPVQTIAVDGITVNGPPISGAPLLALLGDTLTPLADRLDGLSELQDFACSFRDCRQLPAFPIPALGWDVLRSLDDPTEFKRAVSRAQPPMSGLGEMGTALKDSVDRIGAITAAVRSVTGQQGRLSAMDATTLPQMVRRFAAMVRDAETRHAAFSAVGLYSATSRDVLNAGLDAQKKTELVALVNERQARFESRREEYRGKIHTIITQLVNGMETSKSEQSITQQKLARAQEIDALQEDKSGLQQALGADEARFGNVIAAFESIESSLPQGAHLQVAQTDGPFLIAGADARRGATIPARAARRIQGLSAGTLLQVEASGRWSPHCALRSFELLSPENGKPVKVQGVEQAQVGPEGYQVSYDTTGSSSEYNAHGWNQAFTAGVNGEICYGTSNLLEVTGLSAKACAYVDGRVQYTNADTTTSSADRRTSASFAAGIRVRGTPFPDFPAGALVLALMAGEELLEATVVHAPMTSVLVPADADAYLVVNDTVCPEADGVQKLSVTTRAFTSTTAATRAAVDALSVTLTSIRARTEGLVAQGQLTPSQATQLRSEAELRLLQVQAAVDGGTATTLDALPSQVRLLFYAFVDHEILRLERLVQIRAIERQVSLLTLAQQELQTSLEISGAQSRLQWLLPGWMLRSLDTVELAEEGRELLYAVVHYLMPVLRLWYPSVLTNTKVVAAADALLFLDPTTSQLERYKKIAEAISRLRDALADAELAGKPPGTELPVKVVSFPRPRAGDPDPYDGTFGEFRSPWKTVDAARAKLVWDAIDAEGVAPITLTPEDLYDIRNSSDGTLSCWESAPVVKSMMFYVSRTGADSAALNAADRHVHAAASPNQVFATAMGESHFLLENAVWQQLDAKLRYGISGDAIITFKQAPRDTRPVGLSPFGTYRVDFENGWSNPGLKDGQELVVVFELASQAVGAPLGWINACKRRP